jgi:hypothetical protein
MPVQQKPGYKIKYFYYWLRRYKNLLHKKSPYPIGFVPGILRNQYSKLLFIWLFYFRRWFFFYRSSRFPFGFHWDIFFCILLFAFFIILSLSLFSSSENRSSSNLFFHYLARQDLLVFLRFLELFFWINISVNLVEKVIVSTALFSKMSLILLLTFLLIPMSSLPHFA